MRKREPSGKESYLEERAFSKRAIFGKESFLKERAFRKREISGIERYLEERAFWKREFFGRESFLGEKAFREREQKWEGGKKEKREIEKLMRNEKERQNEKGEKRQEYS